MTGRKNHQGLSSTCAKPCEVSKRFAQMHQNGNRQNQVMLFGAINEPS